MSWFSVGITMFLIGIDLLFNIIPHPIGSKLYFTGEGKIYMGSFFLMLGIIILLEKVIKKIKRDKL